MAKQILILVGTKKGAFTLTGDLERRSWELRGPFCETWPLNHVVADPDSGTIYAGGGNEWFGPAVWKSTDLGATWTHSSEGLAYGAGEQPIKSVWSLAPSAGGLYAGVEPAGLFRSNDGGQSWQHVAGLREHPSRPNWQPGGGGLILHSLVPHPTDASAALDRHLRGWACSTRRTAARPGRRATRARAATFCRRSSATRNTASACIAW